MLARIIAHLGKIVPREFHHVVASEIKIEMQNIILILDSYIPMY
jgi:hypothetical protein